MKHAAYLAYADSLAALSDAELTARTTSHLVEARRLCELRNERERYNDEWMMLSACEKEAGRRFKPDLYEAGVAEANRLRDEARRVNQGDRT